MPKHELITANTKRSRTAAGLTTAAVRDALDLLGAMTPPAWAHSGRLRLAHPHASLRELAALAEPPTTKHVIAGRLRRLLAMAERARMQGRR